MTVFFWFLVKSYLSSVCVYSSVPVTVDKSRFTRYQINTAMFIWSGGRNNDECEGKNKV